LDEPIYLTEVTEIGPEVAEFLEAGLLILFEAGAPPELAEIAGPREFRITSVGSKAWQNIQDLGHAVFKFSGSEEAGLPGEIHLEERGAEELGEMIRPGVRVEIKAGA
jgi:PTS system glucitol/sorbitol-specific IIA component